MEYLARLKDILESVVEFITALINFLWRVINALWRWLQLRIPLLKALAARHVRNPSTVFIDLAIVVLAVYVGFGLYGYISIYPKKSETKLSETLSQLYPFPAVKINSSVVWSHQFLVRLGFLNTFNAQAPSDVSSRPPSDTELRTRVMEGIIEDRIVLLEAKKRGIRVTNEELNLAFEKQGKAEEIGPKIRQLYGMTLIQFREILAEQVLKEKVKNAVLARTNIRHILTLDLPSAQEAKRRLDGGADFAATVREFSQDAKTIETGGELGFWRKGELTTQIAPSVEEAVAALQPGQTSSPVQTQFGFHVIQVSERTSGENKTYEEWYKEVLANYTIKRFIEA